MYVTVNILNWVNATNENHSEKTLYNFQYHYVDLHIGLSTDIRGDQRIALPQHYIDTSYFAEGVFEEDFKIMNYEERKRYISLQMNPNIEINNSIFVLFDVSGKYPHVSTCMPKNQLLPLIDILFFFDVQCST